MRSRFEKRDVQRLVELGKRFPSAVLVFATLKSKLDEEEKKLIRPLAMKGRRSIRQRERANKVMVLTATELLNSGMDVITKWKAAGILGNRSLQLDYEYPVRDLCDHTQHIHLDLMPIRTWEEAEREKLQRKRTKGVPSAVEEKPPEQ
jgi:hypothetical protein